MSDEISLAEFYDTLSTVLDSGGEFRLYPKGLSMRPLLQQGKDSVVLVKSDGMPKKNEVVLYRRKDGAFVLHRLIYYKESIPYFCGDNQLQLEKGDGVEIIGVAERFYKKEKCINTSNLSYKLYVSLWRSFFIRKVYFKLRRIFSE